MNSIIQFIRYNNAVPIAVSLVVFLAVGTFAANPEVREGIGESLVSSRSVAKSVDNTKLLAADIANLEFKPQIVAVAEDSNNHYIEYSYLSFMLEDYIWQLREKPSKLTVGKDALGGRDLGDYVAKELKEVIDYERSYLADTQNIEKINGATQKMVTTTYSGLIGKFFDEKQEIFPGYVKVVNAPEPIAAPINNPIEVNNLAPTVFAQSQIPAQITAEYIRSIVKEFLSRVDGSDNNYNRNADINDNSQRDNIGVVSVPDDSVPTAPSATTMVQLSEAVLPAGDSPVPVNSVTENQNQTGTEQVLPPVATPAAGSLLPSENQLTTEESQPSPEPLASAAPILDE